MKKILSILLTLGIICTSSVNAISCNQYHQKGITKTDLKITDIPNIITGNHQKGINIWNSVYQLLAEKIGHGVKIIDVRRDNTMPNPALLISLSSVGPKAVVIPNNNTMNTSKVNKISITINVDSLDKYFNRTTTENSKICQIQSKIPMSTKTISPIANVTTNKDLYTNIYGQIGKAIFIPGDLLINDEAIIITISNPNIKKPKYDNDIKKLPTNIKTVDVNIAIKNDMHFSNYNHTFTTIPVLLLVV